MYPFHDSLTNYEFISVDFKFQKFQLYFRKSNFLRAFEEFIFLICNIKYIFRTFLGKSGHLWVIETFMSKNFCRKFSKYDQAYNSISYKIFKMLVLSLKSCFWARKVICNSQTFLFEKTYRFRREKGHIYPTTKK